MYSRAIKEKQQAEQPTAESKENEMLKLALLASIEEQEINARQQQLEDAELQIAIAMSLSLLEEETRQQQRALQEYENQQNVIAEPENIDAPTTVQQPVALIQESVQQVEQQKEEVVQEVVPRTEEKPQVEEVSEPVVVKQQQRVTEVINVPTQNLQVVDIKLPPLQNKSTLNIEEDSIQSAKKIIEQAETDSNQLVERMNMEKKKQEEAIQMLILEKQNIRKEMSEMERLEAEKFQKLKEAAEAKRKQAQILQDQQKQKLQETIQSSVAASSSSVTSSTPQKQLDESSRKSFMLMQKQKLIELKKAQREEAMKDFLEEKPKPEPVKPDSPSVQQSTSATATVTKDQMRDALTKRLRDDLIKSTTANNKHSSVQDMTDKLRQAEVLRREKEKEKEQLDARASAKKKLLDAMFQNVGGSSSAGGDDFKYKEL